MVLNRGEKKPRWAHDRPGKVYILATDWGKTYGFSIWGVYKLLKQGKLLGIKRRGRLYVYMAPTRVNGVD